MDKKAHALTRIVRTLVSDRPVVTIVGGGLLGLLAAILVDVTDADPGALVPDLGMPGWLATTLKLSFLGLAAVATFYGYDKRKSSSEPEKAKSQ